MLAFGMFVTVCGFYLAGRYLFVYFCDFLLLLLFLTVFLCVSASSWAGTGLVTVTAAGGICFYLY